MVETHQGIFTRESLKRRPGRGFSALVAVGSLGVAVACAEAPQQVGNSEGTSAPADSAPSTTIGGKGLKVRDRVFGQWAANPIRTPELADAVAGPNGERCRQGDPDVTTSETRHSAVELTLLAEKVEKARRAGHNVLFVWVSANDAPQEGAGIGLLEEFDTAKHPDADVFGTTSEIGKDGACYGLAEGTLSDGVATVTHVYTSSEMYVSPKMDAYYLEQEGYVVSLSRPPLGPPQSR